MARAHHPWPGPGPRLRAGRQAGPTHPLMGPINDVSHNNGRKPGKKWDGGNNGISSDTPFPPNMKRRVGGMVGLSTNLTIQPHFVQFDEGVCGKRWIFCILIGAK